MKNKFRVINILFFLTINSVYGQNWALDGTFGNGGLVSTNINNGNNEAFAITTQIDGKIIVGGYSNNNNNTDFTIARYKTDGSLDLLFNSNGIVVSDFMGKDDYGYALAIQPDGKILLAGDVNDNISTNVGIIRYNTSGVPDNTFGINGKVVIDINGLADHARSIALQLDGKILVAGYSESDFLILRFNPNGTLDNTFSSDGIITTSIGINNDIANSIAVQPDGKIVVIGESYNDSSNGSNIALVRYNTNGTLDNSFGFGGKVTSDIATWDEGKSVRVLSNGMILLSASVGVASLSPLNDFCLLELATPKCLIFN